MKTVVTIECDSPDQAARLLKYGTARRPEEIVQHCAKTFEALVTGVVKDHLHDLNGMNGGFGTPAAYDFIENLKKARADATEVTMKYADQPVPEEELY